MVKRTYFILVSVFLMASCSYHLSMEKRPYIGNQLRIDGFYYTVGVDSFLHAGYFFYRDGSVSYRGGRYHAATMKSSFHRDIINEKHILYARKGRFAGGLFQINDSIIKFEKWYPSPGGMHKCYIREGIIINDTTFIIRASYRSVKGKKKDFDKENKLYHFRHYTPKPDSTNLYIHIKIE